MYHSVTDMRTGTENENVEEAVGNEELERLSDIDNSEEEEETDED